MSEYVFKLPDLGEGTVEAEISEWMVKIGDIVKEEDTICAMLTDKAAVELTAPVSGRVTALAGGIGDMITVGTPLITFATASEAANEPAREEAASGVMPSGGGRTAAIAAGAPAVTATPAQTDTGVRTSPSIRRQAREAGIDLHEVHGTGPRGRIQQVDFDDFLARKLAVAKPSPSPAQRGEAAGTTEVRIVGLRRKIAQNLEQSSREIPHFAYVEEVDVTALESLRRHLNEDAAGSGASLTFLPFIALALTRILPRFPQCNAHYDKERNTLVQHHAVHLGIATQTQDGLKVPVVRHAQDRSLADMAAEIRRVSQAARDNTASREELSGSTITITSLGKLGGIVTTPLINVPEVAIIGVNKAVQRPVVQEGQVVVRLMMNLSSSFDHRFVDGHDGASLIQALKSLLEQPATIFMT
jgi:2-oxoisovalerate dehydrogenase E2 component (dihydrolipoyl transacylase)